MTLFALHLNPAAADDADRATYYDRHRDQVRENQRVYREMNREKIRAIHRAYYRKNRAKITAYKRDRWHQKKGASNPDGDLEDAASPATARLSYAFKFQSDVAGAPQSPSSKSFTSVASLLNPM